MHRSLRRLISLRRVPRAFATAAAVRTSSGRLAAASSADGGGGGGREREGTLLAAVSSIGFVSVALAKQKDEKDRVKQEAEAIRQADVLYDAYIIDNVYNLLNHYDTTGNVELLWRLARATCERAKLARDRTQKKALMYEAWFHAKRALTLEGADKCFAAHKWYAIILDYIGEYEGIKYRLQHSPEVKEHLLKATELNAADATTWHILGLWHWAFADMPRYQRMVAGAVFAQPPTASYEEALAYFDRAERMEPAFYSMNHLYMAKCHLALGNKQEAKGWLQKVVDRGMVSADDLQARQEADKLINGL